MAMNTRANPPAPPRVRVRVDPTRCVRFGYCAEFCPEHFTLDEWGYAWLRKAEATGEQLALLRETARRCPTGAILVDVQEKP
jgi:ferredoxin